MASKLVQQTKKVENIVYVQGEALSMIQDPGKVEVNILYMGRNLLIKDQVLLSRHSSTMKARHEKTDLKEYMITKNRVAVF